VVASGRFFTLLGCALLLLLPSTAAGQSKKRKARPEDPGKLATRLVEELKAPGIPAARQREIRKALREIGPPAAKPLARALPRLKGKVAVVAVDVLGKLKKNTTARDALIKATQRELEHELLRHAAEGLSQYKGSASVQALLRLVDHHGHEVDAAALQSLATLCPPGIWKPLLKRLVAGDDVEAGGGADISAVVDTLSALLTASPKPGKVLDLFEACGEAKPKFRRPFFEVFLSGEKVASPYLIRLVFLVGGKRKPEFPKEPEGYGKEGYGGPAVDQVFGEGGAVSRLRPHTDALCSTAVRALGRIGEPDAFPVLLRALTSPLAGVRVAAIDALGHVLRGRREKELVVNEVILSLSDGNRGVKIAAHRFLRRQTGQNLPRSYTAWTEWARKSSKERVLEAAERMAVAEGFESLRDFLRSEGHQGFDDYLRAGGAEEIQDFLDKKPAEPTGDKAEAWKRMQDIIGGKKAGKGGGK
jgi:hypothetical protein